MRDTRLYQMLGCVTGTVYLAVMTELMTKRNNLADGVNSWAFGQVLAIMMLLGPLIELASALVGMMSGGDTEQHDQGLTMTRQRI